jgi:hypothetical protein
MQIVTDIPDNLYKAIMSFKDKKTLLKPYELFIFNGTPLPEHHGELLILDKNLIKQHLVPFDCSNNFWLNEIGIALSTIKTIPATKEGDEE